MKPRLASQTSLRIDADAIARADALIPRIRDSVIRAVAGPNGLSRAAVLRLAVERGLTALEREGAPLVEGMETIASLNEGETPEERGYVDGYNAAWAEILREALGNLHLLGSAPLVELTDARAALQNLAFALGADPPDRAVHLGDLINSLASRVLREGGGE